MNWVIKSLIQRQLLLICSTRYMQPTCSWSVQKSVRFLWLLIFKHSNTQLIDFRNREASLCKCMSLKNISANDDNDNLMEFWPLLCLFCTKIREIFVKETNLQGLRFSEGSGPNLRSQQSPELKQPLLSPLVSQIPFQYIIKFTFLV